MLWSVIRNYNLINYCTDCNFLKEKKKGRKSENNWNEGKNQAYK
jgi:hypothetical protein